MQQLRFTTMYYFSHFSELARWPYAPCNVGWGHSCSCTQLGAQPGMECPRLPFFTMKPFFPFGLSSFRSLTQGSFMSAGFQESKNGSWQASQRLDLEAVVCRSPFVQANDRQLYTSLPNSIISDFTLAARNQPQWKYLHHSNWQMV